MLPFPLFIFYIICGLRTIIIKHHILKHHISELRKAVNDGRKQSTPNFPTNIVDFGGSDSSIILIYRGGILMSIGKFPEI